jgi:hypothetical protein
MDDGYTRGCMRGELESVPSRSAHRTGTACRARTPPVHRRPPSAHHPPFRPSPAPLLLHASRLASLARRGPQPLRDHRQAVVMEVDELDFLSSSTLHRCVRSAGHVRNAGQRKRARWHPLCTAVGGSGAAHVQSSAAWRSTVAVRRYAVHAAPSRGWQLWGRRRLNARGGGQAPAAVAQGSGWQAAEHVCHGIRAGVASRIPQQCGSGGWLPAAHGAQAAGAVQEWVAGGAATVDMKGQNCDEQQAEGVSAGGRTVWRRMRRPGHTPHATTSSDPMQTWTN